MPFIPNVPGVPALSSYAPNNVVELLTTDILSAVVAALFPNTWGIFLDDLPVPVIAYNSFVSFDYKQDFPISTYPVEQGSFTTYDKVRLPAEIRVRLAQGGSVFERQLFLDTIAAVMTTTGLYTVVTPDQIYLNFNFTHRNVTRTAEQGVGLVVVDLWLTEVIESALASFQATANAAIAGVTGLGGVTAQTPPSTFSFPSGSLQ